MWSHRLLARTPMLGAYLRGAAAHPGGSVVAINGRNAARQVLEALTSAAHTVMTPVALYRVRHDNRTRMGRGPFRARPQLRTGGPATLKDSSSDASSQIRRVFPVPRRNTPAPIAA